MPENAATSVLFARSRGPGGCGARIESAVAHGDSSPLTPYEDQWQRYRRDNWAMWLLWHADDQLTLPSMRLAVLPKTVCPKDVVPQPLDIAVSPLRPAEMVWL